ncbi:MULTISPECIES: LLM class F420-dependent oxidoreductase [unclassified Pseudonocardia]|jgi:F420-dependent oxidoreductase-like protein|uniref:LLM class F420-dependent oxidoreductase n=1 Tax=unclassified Pseudonocardia TaxID=2619320 RepID=UPI0009618983|nr:MULTISPECIES: LLM class F420-dependent oxidoreductase [unclassified Pseudonocardia]MBN9097284.1 LLM class F420-dependent oxidoreductase [Pseudonocardia sp.]OJY48852.1 MAG: LLM class F420-dependent oxidoreductase [Pseudonocardia sp. 73-21]
MKLSTQLQYGDDPIRNAEAVVALEQAGLDVVWVAEAYSYDAVSLMGYLAAKTERVEIGSGILPLYSRTPTLTAMTAAGLDALSDGRMILGLGASGPQVIEGFHGVPYDKPVARTREIIDICRQVWRREKIQHEGLYNIPLPAGEGTGLGKPLKLINHPKRSDIPIWVAALGDKNLEMTAELANGWLPHAVMPETMKETFGPALEAGFAKRAPELGPLQITGGGILALEEEMWEPARQLARAMYALYIGGMGARGKNFYNTVFQRQGYVDEAKLVQDLYLDGRKDEAAAALPSDFIDRVTLIGPAGHVKERIAALREAGITHLHVNPVGSDAPKLISQVKEWIV